MSASLAISLGQHSDKGRKPANQDFYGALIPTQPALDLKGIAIALADGISTSTVSSIAAQTAIKSFLTDYYGTSDAWPVKTSAHRVISATNAWLHAQTRALGADDADSGYVCTLSVLVLKSRAAYIFHIGDSRVYRLAGRALEQLTTDHRVPAAPNRFYLGRALGIGSNVEIDYRSVPVGTGDVFVLTTDGVHEHVDGATIAEAIAAHPDDLDTAARHIVTSALANGSPDNLTIQIVRVDALPGGEAADFLGQSADLPLPPPIEPGMDFDGYRILRPLRANARSQVFLAQDSSDGRPCVIKVPGSDMRSDPAFLRRFMMEEWIARRLNTPHALAIHDQDRKRHYLYLATEYVDGQTLTQWMADHPRPDLNAVRDIIEQVARGLNAFHRQEMVHQDLRPDNIMIDKTGTVKIIDFGSTKVPGLIEAQPMDDDAQLGTVQYAAPEYRLGDAGTDRSDQFSLGVIAYQMLTGQLPYGPHAAMLHTRADLARLRYQSASTPEFGIPDWIDRALEKAVHPDPARRYEALSEFTYDLRHPNPEFATLPPRPLLTRNPVRFWQMLSLALAGTVLVLLGLLVGG
ncbi:bifunctional protein-serine/threonine kinase/phosphatase [Devosia ginsengisoli]|uniref:Bifunctional protein-serine/threonine kinase/phosphatase n=1 Tax=Devosia ginsengisoli TaxID=400770 RepID=A0A5B8LRT8_9HYPH|nr:bifunctional protein-serine/threonine kinase/phosphatase [Devosia ginsengisoli]QDZ11007.1 bifunctional protein-serine/threonine kinase/phosphatase [Devosia ginsengisoli]